MTLQELSRLLLHHLAQDLPSTYKTEQIGYAKHPVIDIGKFDPTAHYSIHCCRIHLQTDRLVIHNHGNDTTAHYYDHPDFYPNLLRTIYTCAGTATH